MMGSRMFLILPDSFFSSMKFLSNETQDKGKTISQYRSPQSSGNPWLFQESTRTPSTQKGWNNNLLVNNRDFNIRLSQAPTKYQEAINGGLPIGVLAHIDQPSSDQDSWNELTVSPGKIDNEVSQAYRVSSTVWIICIFRKMQGNTVGVGGRF